MKLFSWMHRKIQKDGMGSFKGSTIGSGCLFMKQEDRSEHDLKQFKEKTVEINEEEPTDEIFPGFLTIGTLSVEALTDPPTPTFDMPYQETEAEVIPEMNYDLKVINDELEKFLKAEAGCEGSDEHESSDMETTPTSTASLSDKEKEDQNKLVTAIEYPLQGYLLASSTETSEATLKAKKEKSSFKKLLLKSSITLRSFPKSGEEIQKEFRKVSKSSKMEKLKMIKRLFPKKVHPQVSTDHIIEPNKFSEHDSKAIHKNSDYNYLVSTVFSQKRTRADLWKEENQHSKMQVNLSQEANSIKKEKVPLKELSDGEGKEHWINTDADYLVLEL